MPEPLNLFDVLLGRSKPNPDMKPVFTPQDQAPPNVLDPAIDFVRGLGYFPTDPLPPDAGGSYGAGAMLAAGAPAIGAFKKWRPVMSELNDIISSAKSDPMREVLLSRVTPTRVAHRTPINIPEGFELPTEFGPKYTSRPQALIDKYVQPREIPKSSLMRGAKLTEKQVGLAKGMLEAGLDHDKIAQEVGISPVSISQIARGESWNSVKAIPMKKAGK